MELQKNLMQHIAQGDEDSFREAFDLYYTSLCFFADKFLNDNDEARSLVQQVFVDLWVKRNKLVIEKSLRPYLFMVVRNFALDFLKHKLVESKYLQNAQPETIVYDRDLIEEAELIARINSAVESLPEKCREIFILCRFKEYSYRMVALKLGISVKTVEMQMGIALKKMRTKLADNQELNLLF